MIHTFHLNKAVKNKKAEICWRENGKGVGGWRAEQEWKIRHGGPMAYLENGETERAERGTGAGRAAAGR